MTRSSIPAAAVIVLFMWGPRAQAQSPEDLVFAVPDGWTDLSPGANVASVSPDLVAEIRSGNYAFYAMDLTTQDAFAENVNAMLLPDGALRRVTEQALQGFAESLGAAVVPHGGTLKIWERAIIQINGIAVGQIVADLTMRCMRTRIGNTSCDDCSPRTKDTSSWDASPACSWVASSGSSSSGAGSPRGATRDSDQPTCSSLILWERQSGLPRPRAAAFAK